jgi:dihydrofolate reductase
VKIKTCVFVATSLDGFIAREDDALDWLEAANKKIPKEEDLGYREFFDSVDVLILGRITFEKALTFSEWSYSEKRVIVLSSRQIQIPTVLQRTVSVLALSPVELIDKLSLEGVEKVYVDGGKTIQRFLSANLIDEITITIIPVLIGKGKPLFSSVEKDIELDLISSKAYDFGFVQNKYRIRK